MSQEFLQTIALEDKLKSIILADTKMMDLPIKVNYQSTGTLVKPVINYPNKNNVYRLSFGCPNCKLDQDTFFEYTLDDEKLVKLVTYIRRLMIKFEQRHCICDKTPKKG